MADEAEKAPENSGRFKFFAFKLLPYILMIILGAVGGIYIAQKKPDWFGLSKGSAQVQAEIDALVVEVGKLIALPSDEKPTVATVTDLDKVKDQPFFKNAKNGDKVLIYTNAKKAILYRPGEKRIIEVGAVNINQTTPASPTPEPSVSPSPKASISPTPTPTETPKQ